MATILEELKKATEQVQKVAEMEGKQREQYRSEVIRLFFEFQKAVYSMVTEEGVILNNFEWKEKRQHIKVTPGRFIEDQAELFAAKYGFTEEIVLKLIETKNNGLSYKSGELFYYFMLVPKK